MKILLLVCLLLGFLRTTARSDLVRRPPSIPTTITVANLAKFPAFKFTYTTAEESEPKDFEPLREKLTIHNRRATIRFFVEDISGGERFEWASIKTAFRPKTSSIAILGVRHDGDKIKVNYKLDPESNSDGKGSSAAFPFALSSLSLGVVVFLTHRKRAAFSGT